MGLHFKETASQRAELKRRMRETNDRIEARRKFPPNSHEAVQARLAELSAEFNAKRHRDAGGRFARKPRRLRAVA